MELLLDPKNWMALLTLILLEIVLGIDNVVFLSILSAKLPVEQQPKARLVGLGLAVFMRIGLLFSLSWLIHLTAPWFTVFGVEISGRDLILILGGLFLIAKSTHEIHQRLEGDEGEASTKVKPTFTSVIIQILLLDVVFSLDSVITAVGMVEHLPIMVTAVVISVLFMMVFSGTVSRFVERHPTVKVLALSFLLLIGLSLLAEGFDHHIPKGYIYFAMAFSIFVEIINLQMRKRETRPVKLREPYAESSKA